jgi:ABC-type multidrug transport system permease subunit
MMLEILQYYTSSFWVWLGITAGMYVAGAMFIGALGTFAKTAWQRIKPSP